MYRFVDVKRLEKAKRNNIRLKMRSSRPGKAVWATFRTYYRSEESLKIAGISDLYPVDTHIPKFELDTIAWENIVTPSEDDATGSHGGDTRPKPFKKLVPLSFSLDTSSLTSPLIAKNITVENVTQVKFPRHRVMLPRGEKPSQSASSIPSVEIGKASISQKRSDANDGDPPSTLLTSEAALKCRKKDIDSLGAKIRDHTVARDAAGRKMEEEQDQIEKYAVSPRS